MTALQERVAELMAEGFLFGSAVILARFDLGLWPARHSRLRETFDNWKPASAHKSEREKPVG